MKINEALQPRHREEFASNHYRVVVDTKHVTPAMLFNPEHWAANTILRKGDILRCVADDGSYAFDLIVDSQKLDTSKSVKNMVTVSVFPALSDAVIEAAEVREAEKSAAREAAAPPEPVAPPVEKPTEAAAPVPPTEKPALDPSKYSFGKRKEIAKREKMMAKRKEIDDRNKARTAERLAAEAAAGDAA
jgi:hypothetical protein